MSTGSSPIIRGVRLLDESIFLLLIGPPETDLSSSPTFQSKYQLAVIGRVHFFEMNSSDLIPTTYQAHPSPNISSRSSVESIFRSHEFILLFLIGWHPTYQTHVQSSCYKVRQQSSRHRQTQTKRCEWISSCVSTNIEYYTMETYDISDDRTVSVVKVQDGEKMVIIKENGSSVNSST